MRRALLIAGVLLCAGLAYAYAKPVNCSSLNGCADAGTNNCSNLPTASAPPDAGPPAYLIPEDAGFGGNILVHVNATDLNAGTCTGQCVGGAWTLHGSLTYNAADTPRPTISGFASGDYFSQTSASPANVSGFPYTAVFIVKPVDVSTPQVILNTGADSVAGIYEDIDGTQASIAVSTLGAATYTSPTIGAGFDVFMVGVDASGNSYASVNNGSVSTMAGNVYSQSVTTTYLGTYNGVADPLLAPLTEVMISTAVPSSAAFASIYALVLANE